MLNFSMTKRILAFSLFMFVAAAMTAPSAFAAEYDVLNGTWKCDPQATVKLSNTEVSNETVEFMKSFSMKVDAGSQTLSFLSSGAGDAYPFTYVGKKGGAIILNSSDSNMCFEMQGANRVVVYPEGNKAEAFVFVKQ